MGERVETASREPVTVEWITFTPRERGVPVVARRTFETGGRVRLWVAASESRYLRFMRPGLSPVTVAATELVAVAPPGWRLPDTPPGGEFIARIEPAEVVPERYQLRGPRAVDLRPKDDVIAARGLPPSQ